MITIDGVGLSFLNLKMTHMMCLANSAFKSNLKKSWKFEKSEVIIGTGTVEQVDITGSEDSDDYLEPDQISELNGTSEAVTTPEIPEAAAAPDVPTT